MKPYTLCVNHRDINVIIWSQEIHQVRGLYDLIVRMEAEKKVELEDAIEHKIRCFEQIRLAKTMFVI